MEQLGIKQDIAKLQQILGSKLYSNKYSFLSEVLQNSTDAMRKCGKQDEAFEVGIVNKDEKTIFYTRDTGCSFDSIERFKELMSLLESSKSQIKDSSENQELGKFGIGSISVAAYNNRWNYIVYKNQRAFNAELQEIEGKGLFMDVSDYYDTEEADGVYFQVEINTNLVSFFNNLIEKAKYFQNIKFKFDESSINSIQNYNYPTRNDLMFLNEKFQIFKSDDFQYSTLNQNNNLHICIDQYTYDINWNHIGIKPIQLPIALRFNLNDFDINPTREVLSIGEDYKDKIINKIEKVALWMINRYNEENPIYECSTLKDYEEELKRRENKTIKIGDANINIFEFCNEYTSKIFNLPTFKGISITKLKDFYKFLSHYWNNFYNINSIIVNGVRKQVVYGQLSTENIFFIEKSIRKVYQDWFKTNSYSNNKFKFYTVGSSLEFYDNKEDKTKIYYQNWVKYNKQEKYDELEFLNNDEYVEIFNNFKILKEEFEKSYFQKVEDVVPIDWVNSKPKPVKVKKEKLQKSEEEVFLKYPRTPQKSTDWKAVWEDKNIKVRDLYKLPKLHIYGTEKHRKSLETFFKKFQRNNNNLQLIMVNDKTEKLIKEENPHNFINIEDLKDRFSVLNNYITASYIRKNLNKYDSILKNSQLINTYISSNISKDIDKINEIMKKYDVDSIFYDVERGNCPEIINNFVQFYTENPKMYNQEYIELYNKLEKALSKLDFVDLFITDINSNASYMTVKKELALKTVRELCKIRNIRMNWENYNLDRIEEYYFEPVAVSIVPELELVENE